MRRILRGGTASCKLRRMGEDRTTDIYRVPAAGAAYRRIARRKRRLATRSRYPAPHRGERRMSKREVRRRALFWGLVVAIGIVGGYAFYKSRNYTTGTDIRPSPIDFKDPIGR